MNALYSSIREKRVIMRDIYGGMMSLEELSKELRMNHNDARRWAEECGIGNLIGKRVKYETDEVARHIVLGRGMV